ncbi:hypothetical protein AOLI_G00276890 [Acnodon oligacanthus]
MCDPANGNPSSCIQSASSCHSDGSSQADRRIPWAPYLSECKEQWGYPTTYLYRILTAWQNPTPVRVHQDVALSLGVASHI